MHRQFTVLLMCCAMSLLCLSYQSVYTQDEKRVDWKETEERASNEDFYRVIIENNIFRPLGWRKKLDRNPEYTLLATWVSTQGIVAKALVVEQKSGQLYYVAKGEKVGNAIIEKVETNQVSLKVSDNIVTLKAESMQFLNSSKSSGGRLDEGRGAAASTERSRDERGRKLETIRRIPSKTIRVEYHDYVDDGS